MAEGPRLSRPSSWKPAAHAEQSSTPGVISGSHFAAQLNRFVPTYPVFDHTQPRFS
jgi:hypothetical protein